VTLAVRLEDYWLSLRLKKADVPAAHLLKVVPSQNPNSVLPTIQDALELYLRVKGRNKRKPFFTHSERSVNYLEECLGCRSLDQYSSADAALFRDWLRKRGLSTSSIQRNFFNVKALVNFCIKELGLNCRNAFTGVYLFPEEDFQKRQPLSLQQIGRVQQRCYEIDDDVRWMVALISDTGMRLAEAAGLLIEDIKIDCPFPHVSLNAHSGRPLKTKSSQRTIPLVGASLWAARQILASAGGVFCFPRYTDDEVCKSNSASAAMNKWLKTVAGDTAVIHGLRHSFRDRLRALEAPNDLIDQLGGWSLQSVGQSYGRGYPLENTSKWMQKMVLQ
jgi:integrase